MSTPYKDIRDAINARIAANWTATPIHWTNTRRNPTTVAWIQPRVIFHNAAQVELGPSGRNRIVGDVHCNVFAPIGEGDDEIMTRVDTFLALFPRGYLLPTASKTITFEVPESREALEEEDWYQVPAYCPFYVDMLPS